MIIGDDSGFTNKIIACRGDGYGFVYLPANKGVTVKLSLISSDNNVSWFNPRTGKYKAVGEIKENEKYFEVPVQGVDWVLVVEAANQ